MADGDFDAIYGDAKPTSEAATIAKSGVENDILDADNDDELFQQLYGDVAAEELGTISARPAETDVVLNPPNISAALGKSGLAEPTAGEQPERDGNVKSEEEEEDEETGSETSEDEDDLVITLDENATEYEPSQSKFQKTFKPPGGGLYTGTGEEENGAAAIPGLGGAAPRVAIGGIPRSAIPGLAVSFAAAGQSGPPKSVPADFQTESLPVHEMRMEDAVFPSQWSPGLPIKLPGQTRVSPEEYKEFLSLGHGDIFGLDIDSVIDAPWRLPGTDPGDFFNYGMNISEWKAYQERVKQFRLEFTMKGQIQTFDQSQAETLPPMLGPGDEDAGDRSLQTSMLDARDGSYEAFVTSERPERVSWQRFGSSWDHTIILTGHELDFGDVQARGQQMPGIAPKSLPGIPPGMSARPQFRPHARPGFQRPPPPPARDMSTARLPPPFLGMQSQLPPPFIGGPQSMPQKQTPKLGLGMDTIGSSSGRDEGPHQHRGRRGAGRHSQASHRRDDTRRQWRTDRRVDARQQDVDRRDYRDRRQRDESIDYDRRDRRRRRSRSRSPISRKDRRRR